MFGELEWSESFFILLSTARRKLKMACTDANSSSHLCYLEFVQAQNSVVSCLKQSYSPQVFPTFGAIYDYNMNDTIYLDDLLSLKIQVYVVIYKLLALVSWTD